MSKMELNLKQVRNALEWCSSGGNCIKCAENVKNPRLSKEGCMAVQMRNALSLINELTEENERLRAEGKWISVADGLPEPYTTVLVYGMGSIASDYLTSRGVWYNHEIITHWKHLPESPKMKGE